MSVALQDPVTDVEEHGFEELDERKVEALRWLGRQLIWQRQLENLRSRTAVDNQDRASLVGR